MTNARYNDAILGALNAIDTQLAELLAAWDIAATSENAYEISGRISAVQKARDAVAKLMMEEG